MSSGPTRCVDYFTKLGYTNHSEQYFNQLFAEAIAAGRPDSDSIEETVTRVSPIYSEQDVKAQFLTDLKFAHFVLERPEVAAQANRTQSVPVRARLADQIVVQRHEILRTRLIPPDEDDGSDDYGEHLQGISSRSAIKLNRKTITQPEEAHEELRRMRDEEWDLHSWESMKITLASLSDTVHYVVVGSHHITLDGMSFSVLFLDLEAAYTDKPLPPLSVKLGKEKGDRIKQFAWRCRSTIFHVFQSVLQAQLFQYMPDMEGLCIGMADANRLDHRFMGTIGFLLNLLPLYFSRSPNGTEHPPLGRIYPSISIFVDYRQIVQDRSTFGSCRLGEERWLNAATGYGVGLGVIENPNESYVKLLEHCCSGIDLMVEELVL
ncbi:hypothetical protein F5Y07DRAFT_400149 [Xylaria sp. FL0933]|nr:hypothetical protein F5Y07DRAFT_400149 [Xylaria sp. FL0933]